MANPKSSFFTSIKKYSKPLIASIISLLLGVFCSVVLLPSLAATSSTYPTLVENANSTLANMNQVLPANSPSNASNSNTDEATASENTALDTDTPSEHVPAYNENTAPTPYNPDLLPEEQTNTTLATPEEKSLLEQTNLAELQRRVTDQMLANAGMSREEYNRLKGEIETRQEELQKVNAELNNLEESLHTRTAEVDAMNKLITDTNEKVANLEQEVSTTKQELAASQVLLNHYVKEGYKFNAAPFTEFMNLLFGDNDLGTIISTLDYWSSIQTSQQDITADIHTKKERLDLALAELANDRSVLDQSKLDIAAAEESLQQTKATYDERVAAVKDDISLLKGQQVMEQTGYLAQVYSSLVVTPDAMTQTEADLRAAIVRTALSCLGANYVWGGESWEEGGFDCSGLCQYSYRQNGISIPRVACDQYMGLPKIAMEDLRPGDMIFIGDSAPGIHHVIMYIGDGLTIEAPHTGTVVQIRQLAGRTGIYGCASALAAFSFTD